MRKTGYILIVIAVLHSLAACEKVIEDFDFLESDPKLVVNAPLVSDSAILFHVSHTIGIMDDEIVNFVSNASAGLYRDGLLLENATHLDSGFYSFPASPLKGSTYSIRISAPSYPSAVARIEMPESPPISSVGFVGEDENGVRLRVTIDDATGIENAYGLGIRYPIGRLEVDELGNVTDTIFEGTGEAYLRSKDINITGGLYGFTLNSEKWDDYADGVTLLVEDDLVDGKEFSIDISTPDLYFAIAMGQEIIIQVEAFSEDYVRFLKSMELYNNSINNPISEKVSLFTNIDGGLGVAHGKTIYQTGITIPADSVSGEFFDWRLF